MALIKSTRQFWNVNICDEKTKTELMSISSTMSITVYRIFIPTALIAIAFMLLSPLFGISSLPLGVWNLERYDLLYPIVVFTQSITLALCVMIMYPFDFMYLAFCTEIIIQSRIMCYYLKNLTVDDDDDLREMKRSHYNKIKMSIRQHNILMR